MAKLVSQHNLEQVRVALTKERQAISHPTGVREVEVRRLRDGTWAIEHQAADGQRIWLDGEALLPFKPAPLRDGCVVRLGPIDLIFLDEDERQRLSCVQRLCDWWDRAEPAPLDLSASALLATADLCGTNYIQSLSGDVRQASAWYRGYLTDNHVERSCLPVPLPYLIDLGALLVSRLPGLRPWGRPSKDRKDLRARYATEYQERHLCMLAYRPAVALVRRRAAGARTKDQTAVVTRFLGDVFSWAAEAWAREDCKGDPRALAAIFAHCSGPPRILTKPAHIQGFLLRLSNVLQHSRAHAEVVPPFERFLLGARARVPDAFTDFDGPLIDECLRSQALEERDHRPEPLARLPVAPRVPSPSPGDHSAIQRVRKTNRLEKLPEVVPQDFALAEVQPHGRRWLLEKLYQEGLLIWERHDHDVEVLRRKFLVCLVADIGPEAQVIAGAGDTGALAIEVAGSGDRSTTEASSAGTHARRLIFECLRDLAAFVRLPGGHLDVHVFLEPVSGRPESRLSWALTLERLQACLGQGPADDMVEVEDLAPGFFFPRHRAVAEHGEHARFIHQVFDESDYDRAVFVFFGPAQTLPALLPEGPLPPRNRGAADAVRLVQLGRWPTTVQVARAERFDDVRAEPVFGVCSDLEWRYALLEDVLGRQFAEHAQSGELRLETREAP